MVGGPPSHSAIKERWGPGLAVRGSPRRQSPHRHPNPNPILRRGAASDGKHHRRRQRHPDAHAAAEDATAPTPPSPPNIAAGAQMASANEIPAGASTTTAFDGLLLLTPLLSASHINPEHVFYSYTIYPDLMNMTKTKSNNGIRARFREETGSGKENRKRTLRPNPNSPNQIGRREKGRVGFREP